MNVAKIKGSHNAMKSGMLAAESIWEKLESRDPEDRSPLDPSSYASKFKSSWVYQDLWEVFFFFFFFLFIFFTFLVDDLLPFSSSAPTLQLQFLNNT